MDAYGTRQLRNAGYRQLDVLAGRHHQVAIFVDDHYNIRQEAMTVLGTEAALDELGVVFFQVAAMRDF